MEQSEKATLTLNLPKITIITPSYNQGQYLEETILSIINQNYPNLEYIIIDGGSTDNSVEIIRKYEKHLAYWVSEPDKGQSHAINKGLEKATGDIFNWINSDDLLLPNALWRIGLVAKTYPNYDVFCGKKRIGVNPQKITHEGQTKVEKAQEQTLALSKISQEGTFFRLDALRQIGYINEDFHFCMDAELFARYLATFGQSKVLLINENWAFFRLNPEGKSINLKDIEIKERYKIAVSLLLSTSDKFDYLSKNTKMSNDYTFHNTLQSYDLPKLQKAITEHLLDFSLQIIDWRTFSRLYFSYILSLKKNDFNKWRVLFSPFIKVKRAFFPIK